MSDLLFLFYINRILWRWNYLKTSNESLFFLFLNAAIQLFFLNNSVNPQTTPFSKLLNKMHSNTSTSNIFCRQLRNYLPRSKTANIISPIRACHESPWLSYLSSACLLSLVSPLSNCCWTSQNKICISLNRIAPCHTPSSYSFSHLHSCSQIYYTCKNHLFSYN